MPKYVLMHASLKMLAADGSKKTHEVGDVVELPAAFVAEHDPKGVNFVTEEKYHALVDQVLAMKKTEALIAAKSDELQTEKDKLAAAKLNAKHLAAIELIESKRHGKPSKPAQKNEEPSKPDADKGARK